MPSPILHLDFETKSTVNIVTSGAFNYAQAPDTDILCMGWVFNDDKDIKLWVPGSFFPEEVLQHLNKNAPRSLYAHNAQFEQLIVRHVLPKYLTFTQPDTRAWYCTAAQARARALPGSLEDLGRCLGLESQKDRRGKELIKILCVPQTNDKGELFFPPPDPATLKELYAYCRRDVEVERLAAKATPALSDSEHRDWVVNEQINGRGLRVDIELAQAASCYAQEALQDIKNKLIQLTESKITSPYQHQRIKNYILPYLEHADSLQAAVTRVRTNRRTGEEKQHITFDKETRIQLMYLYDNDTTLFPVAIRELIGLIHEAGRSSVAKFNNMVTRSDAAGRVRGAYIFSGAGQTGRFSSTGLQLHNFPRSQVESPEKLRDAIINHRKIPNIMGALSSLLRYAIIAAEDHCLVWGDWSSIEARILPWLACSKDSEHVLTVYKENDEDDTQPDTYQHAAADVYKVAPKDVTEVQRAVGKVIVLSAGYQGGYRAFQAMARNYKITVSDADAADIIKKWRSKNDWAVQLWRDLEYTAKQAMRHPGQEQKINRLTYYWPGEGHPLYCQLPSARVLSYPQAIMETVDGKYGPETSLSCIKAPWKPAQGEKEWGRVQLYGGLMAENCSQAIAADILRYAMGLCDEDGWPQVGHTHDELIIEVPTVEVAEAQSALHTIMCELPPWATGIPLACKTYTGKRYHK